MESILSFRVEEGDGKSSATESLRGGCPFPTCTARPRGEALPSARAESAAAAQDAPPLVPKGHAAGRFSSVVPKALAGGGLFPLVPKARDALCSPPVKGGLRGVGLEAPVITRFSPRSLPSVSPFLAAWPSNSETLSKSEVFGPPPLPSPSQGGRDGLHCRVGLSKVLGPPPLTPPSQGGKGMGCIVAWGCRRCSTHPLCPPPFTRGNKYATLLPLWDVEGVRPTPCPPPLHKGGKEYATSADLAKVGCRGDGW